jgi:hypothetical protein
MLNELDYELERRRHRFVRYADDLLILCKSKRSAYRTLEKIMPYIEGKLFLKVNRQKTTVGYIGKTKFLGFTFYVDKIPLFQQTVQEIRLKHLTAKSTSKRITHNNSYNNKQWNSLWPQSRWKELNCRQAY